MPKQVPAVGDVFLVELSDGSFALGQVLETRPVLMNSFTCAFFDRRVSSADEIDFPLVKSLVLSCQFVTRDAFSRGQWRRVLNVAPRIEPADLPHRDKEHAGWVGAKVISSGIMTGFLNACFGLSNWSEMKDPRYYDGLLCGGRQRPSLARVESSASGA
jgi:Immunity protein 26